jgi:hypothetical protein
MAGLWLSYKFSGYLVTLWNSFLKFYLYTNYDICPLLISGLRLMKV